MERKKVKTLFWFKFNLLYENVKKKEVLWSWLNKKTKLTKRYFFKILTRKNASNLIKI